MARAIEEITQYPAQRAGGTATPVQPGHFSVTGEDAYASRLGRLDDADRDLLEVLCLLRPAPEQFLAEEIVAIGALAKGTEDHEAAVADTERRLKDLADRFLLERGDLSVVAPAGAAPGAVLLGFSLHTRARRLLEKQLRRSAAEVEVLHRRAIDYWRPEVDPSHPETRFDSQLTAYQSAVHRESTRWLRAARCLIHHLNRLPDRPESRSFARLTFDQIYFELFWWWGYFSHYEIIDELVGDWKASGDSYESDREWFVAMETFNASYLPAHDGTGFFFEADFTRAAFDWDAVEAALHTIRAADTLDGPVDSLSEHAAWHVRAITDIFLAHCSRYHPDRADPKRRALVDSYYAEARQLFERCVKGGHDDGQDADHQEGVCGWNLPWIDFEEADEAVKRSHESAGGAAKQCAFARTHATSAIRAVLNKGGELTAERNELDYELLASASLVLGDLLVDAGDAGQATSWYVAALTLAYAWHYRPQTDDYTRRFNGSVVAHLERQLAGVERAHPGEGRKLLDRLVDQGYAGAWGTRALGPEASGSLDPADRQSVRVLLVGPEFPSLGRHDVSDIPGALARATERVLKELWRAGAT